MGYRSKPQIPVGMSFLLALRLFCDEGVIGIRRKYSNDWSLGTGTSGLPFHRDSSTCKDDERRQCSNTKIWSTHSKTHDDSALLSARDKKQRSEEYQQRTFASTLKASIFKCNTNEQTPILLNETVVKTV